ncbi:MAG: hypothetical protein J6P72_04420 [Firmicutes bacterium]|nr:hypothetical protein [Bacillota bacterium]
MARVVLLQWKRPSKKVQIFNFHVSIYVIAAIVVLALALVPVLMILMQKISDPISKGIYQAMKNREDDSGDDSKSGITDEKDHE